ncbi:acyltransferase family protein [Mucilaginibacter gotjawali]|uniref:Peptidoglycan/LPS O-acetylase OafA/YrhL n=2 Tax=Mucilaginibacter gotjawali TaxID=1550579 RepID=A0A839SNS7_9SPHI|nr:acyltransferase [Mucilaginibacter gotjawali]MBB3058500.1 peptidoglycan/LPS O-acetylase OafA/YrhL [Mucilaginibacter gotjawali]BAU55724.1 Acyltransferase family protein [Mucilaginibacter gotjawali]
MEISPAAILKTKPHFEILDGLRGVAAISVVCFHFMEIVYSDYSKNFIGHGFLAVDFFFCLSGFVIGYAYDDRIGKMGVVEFFKLRLIRLHPLVLSGSVLGLLAFLFDPFGGHPGLYSAGKIVLIFLCSILMIPFGGMADRGFNLFGINPPAWSLFWEYAANIIYAFVLRRLSRGWLLVLLVPAAAGVCMVCFRAGDLMGGWSMTNFWDGGARIAYSFIAGLLVFRSKWIVKNRLGFTGIAVLLFLAFIMPYGKWNRVTEPLAVLLFFPLVVALGAGATLSKGLKKRCVFAGKLSYPLYMTHYAAMFMFNNYLITHKPSAGWLFLIIPTGMLVLVLISWGIMVLYDIPLRQYLTRLHKQHLPGAGGA